MAEMAYEGLCGLGNIPAQRDGTDIPDRAIQIPLDYFAKGMHQPVPKPLPINGRELLQINNRDAEDVPEHLVTSVILRCAGVSTTTRQYDEYRSATEHARRLQRQSSPRPLTIQKAKQVAESLQDEAEPYIVVIDHLKSYVDEYTDTFLDPDKPRSHAIAAATALHEQTVMYEHPGLESIQSTKPVLRDRAIVAERLFRLILRPDDAGPLVVPE